MLTSDHQCEPPLGLDRRAGPRLTAHQLMALQLLARGYSPDQLAALLPAVPAVPADGRGDAGTEGAPAVLRGAAAALGVPTVLAAVAEARRRGLIV